MEQQSENKASFKLELKGNPWVAISAILAIALIAAVTFALLNWQQNPTALATGISQTDQQALASKALNYLKTGFFDAQGLQASITSIEQVNEGLVKVSLGLSDGTQVQALDVFITADGKQLVAGQVFNLDENLSSTEPAQELQKSDKPSVELFVMSHCPYGTQTEKGILPVVNLLKGNIDFNLRFVYYSMHGTVEVQEETRQYCIQKEQNDKFLDYLNCFLADGNSERCLTGTSIDTVGLSACTVQADKDFNITANLEDNSKWLNGTYPLFDVDKALNEAYGIQGSPTLVINGTQVSSARDSASLLKAICSAFNTPPAECDTVLSSTAPSTGFGFAEGENSTGGCAT